MLNNQAFQNKKILLYGFGISGKSCFNYLKKNNHVEIFDDDETLKNKKNRVFFTDVTKVRKNIYDFFSNKEFMLTEKPTLAMVPSL